MSSRIFGMFLAAVLYCGMAMASGIPGSDAGAPKTILEISPMSVTVDAGKDIQESYTINGQTTATLSGTPVRPEDLRAGMLASITLATDGKTVVALHAVPAPRVTKKPPPPSATTVWIMH
jgi:hypothetical protein